jgi:hypothetical protein
MMMQTPLVACLPEPTCPHGGRHSRDRYRIFTRLSLRDRSPEPPAILTLRHGRSAWRLKSIPP